MLKWLRRKRLSAEGKRRLLLAIARAEEAVVEVHVANILDLERVLRAEVDLDRAMDLYVEMMSLSESRAANVTNRLYARVQEEEDPSADGRRFENVFSGHNPSRR
jgi:K+-sensing histidine kinase KdpD